MFGVVEIDGKFYVTKNGAVCDDYGWTRREDAEATAHDYAQGDTCPCAACKDEREHMAASETARQVRELTDDDTVTREEAAAVVGGLAFVLADVRGSARIRANQKSGRMSTFDGADAAKVANPSVAVVFDMEARDAPVPIGTYVNTDEDVVSYIDPAGVIRYAPTDCVRIVKVEVR